jgi:hypothetical protein
MNRRDLGDMNIRKSKKSNKREREIKAEKRE